MTMERFSQGQPVRPSASRENRVSAGIEVIETMKRRLAGGGSSAPIDSNTLLAKNAGGDDVPMFGVVEIFDTLFVPSDNVVGFQNNRAVQVRVPTSATAGKFGIALEPIAAGKFGQVAVDGIAVAQVNITDPSGFVVGEVDGETNFLVTNASGTARILAREAGSSGVVWAIIQLGVAASSGAVERFLVDDTATTPVGGASPPQWDYSLLPSSINSSRVVSATGGAAVIGWNLYEDQANWGHGQSLALANGATITPSPVTGPVWAKWTGLTSGGTKIYEFDVACPTDVGC